MKKMYAVLLAVLFVALTTSVFAFGPGSGPTGKDGYGPGFGGPMGLGARLNLSEDQKQQMRQLMENHRNNTQTLREELVQKRIELRTVFADPKATDASILAKQNEFNTLKQKMQDEMVQLRLEQRKILTPEQLAKIPEGGWGPGSRRGFGPSGHRGFGPGACDRS